MLVKNTLWLILLPSVLSLPYYYKKSNKGSPGDRVNRISPAFLPIVEGAAAKYKGDNQQVLKITINAADAKWVKETQASQMTNQSYSLTVT